MSFKILLYTITIIVYNNTAINDIIVNLLFKKYIIINDVIHNGKSKVINVNDWIFYTYKNINYLLGYIKQNICTSLVLPHSYNDEKYEVYEHAFRGCKNLLSIEIPSNVSKLNYRSFENCRLLINFVIEGRFGFC